MKQTLVDQIDYSPCSGEIVFSLVEDFFTEDLTRLLSNALSEKLIVDLDARNVSFIAWNHRVVSWSRSLFI